MNAHLVWALGCFAAVVIGVVAGRRSARAGGGSATTAPPSLQSPPAQAPSDDDTIENLPRALWSLPLGIVVADREGTVVYRNEVAQSFVDGRHGEALVAVAINELAVAAASSGPVERRIDLYGPPRRHLSVKAAPMTEAGQRTGSLVIVEDVTEAHRVDTVRRDFVANVSHELKTPVGAIGVLAEALRGEDDPDVVDRLAGRLQDEAIRLGNTIDDLLALSRIESGELFDPVELDLDDVVSAAIERNASAAELRNVVVVRDPAPGPVVVLGDRGQLVSAVGNLVDNAVKYSDPGSEVTVALSSVAGRGQVEVVDRGVGIPEADRERIFERFYRVDPARSRYTGGTGLGLAIVRHVARNHGGEVTVRSAEGEGSRFALALPLASPVRPGSGGLRAGGGATQRAGATARGE